MDAKRDSQAKLRSHSPWHSWIPITSKQKQARETKQANKGRQK